MIDQITHNVLCWAIIALALVCYHQLWLNFLDKNLAPSGSDQPSHSASPTKQEIKNRFSGILIGALPLLGLLGTICGLLDCFSGIASEGASSDLVSGGIADALLTTQLGLVCAIPAWLLHAWVQTKELEPKTQLSQRAL